MTIIISAEPADLPQVVALLELCGLPLDGLETTGPLIVVAREAESVIGCAALEVYGTTALLRSTAVDPAHRSQGLGTQLTNRLNGRVPVQ